MRHQGVIALWKDEQGYGFIAPREGDIQIFVHIKAFSNRQIRPTVGEVVSYELARDLQGRTRAEKVRVAGNIIVPTAQRNRGIVAVAYTVLFLTLVAGTTLAGILPLFIPGIYLGFSIVTFLVYWKDKRSAMNGEWRTDESTLQFLALAGGWPGALAAQRILRHKSSKRSFQITFWVVVVLNSAALFWLLTPQGTAFLHSQFIDEMWL